MSCFKVRFVSLSLWPHHHWAWAQKRHEDPTPTHHWAACLQKDTEVHPLKTSSKWATRCREKTTRQNQTQEKNTHMWRAVNHMVLIPLLTLHCGSYLYCWCLPSRSPCMPCKPLQLLQRTERSNGPGKVKVDAAFCFVCWHVMDGLKRNMLTLLAFHPREIYIWILVISYILHTS